MSIENDAELEKNKVVIKTYSSAEQESSMEGLLMYYCCCCGNYCMILDQPLESLPVRKFDQTRVLDLKENRHSYKLKEGKTIVIKRDDRNEIHYLLVCTNCHVPIAYKVSKKEESSKYLYILNDSVCDDPSVLNNQIADEDHLVPSCIQRPTESSRCTDIYVHVTYNCKSNQITGIDDQFVYVDLKISDADEVRRNSYLLRFFSDLFIISYKYISLSMNSRGLLVEIEEHDPEDIYLKIRKLLKSQ